MRGILKILLVFVVILTACDRNYVPKPEGYLRVVYPEKAYQTFNEAKPYSFEYPAYARVEKHKSKATEPYWYDLEFPDFNGTIYLSYKQIDGDIRDYIQDTRTLVYKHASRSDGIDEIPFLDTVNRRYGILYDLRGNVASPVQFFLTDSTRHFLRGSLYFNATPNRDSLNPIINYIRQDIDHLMESVRWK